MQMCNYPPLNIQAIPFAYLELLSKNKLTGFMTNPRKLVKHSAEKNSSQAQKINSVKYGANFVILLYNKIIT